MLKQIDTCLVFYSYQTLLIHKIIYINKKERHNPGLCRRKAYLKKIVYDVNLKLWSMAWKIVALVTLKVTEGPP